MCTLRFHRPTCVLASLSLEVTKKKKKKKAKKKSAFYRNSYSAVKSFLTPPPPPPHPQKGIRIRIYCSSTSLHWEEKRERIWAKERWVSFFSRFLFFFLLSFFSPSAGPADQSSSRRIPPFLHSSCHCGPFSCQTDSPRSSCYGALGSRLVRNRNDAAFYLLASVLRTSGPVCL